MPADLTREEIDAMQDRLAVDGDPTHDDMWVLLDYARSEPTRLAAARAEGVREGIEMAAQYIHDWDPEKLGRPGMYASVDLAEAFDTGAIDASISIEHGVRALSPAPAEPSAPVAPEPVIKTIERVLDECSAWIARPSPDVTKRVAIAAGFAWQAAMDHEANRIPDLEERITALEAENAKLREGLDSILSQYVKTLDAGAGNYDGKAFAESLPEVRRDRALLQGGPDAG